MEWIINNWFLLFFLALCIGMHFLVGGHGRHGKYAEEESEEQKGHAHAVSMDGSPGKEQHGSCH